MKQKQIGGIVLDYEYFAPESRYSDGEIEEVLLEAARTNQLEQLLASSNSWAVLYHCSNIRENLLEWYPFKKDGTLLEVGSGCGALTGLFSRKVKSVTCIELSERRSMINAYRNKECDNIRIMLGNFQDIKIDEKFDYITLIGVWEYAGSYINGENPYIEMLQILKQYLKEDGKIIIAIENKMGIKYWNGALEDHTSRLYSGLNDYVDDKRKVRTFSRPEIERMFEEIGENSYKFYYPMPDYKLPDVIYSDDRVPNPGEIRQYREDYNAPRMYSFYDATIQDQLCADNMVSYFANSYLIECGSELSNVIYAKYSRLRKSEYAISTIITSEDGQKKVTKKALSPLAKRHVEGIVSHDQYNLLNFEKMNGKLDDESYVVDYIDGLDIEAILYNYRNNVDVFMHKVKEIISLYLQPSKEECFEFVMTEEYKEYFGDNVPVEVYSLKYTNVDLIFSNLRMDVKGKVYCIDNEWLFDFPIPYEYVIWRALNQIYSKYMVYLKNEISRSDFMVELGINVKNLDVYQKMEKKFSEKVFGVNYKKQYRKSAMTYEMRFFG